MYKSLIALCLVSILVGCGIEERLGDNLELDETIPIMDARYDNLTPGRGAVNKRSRQSLGLMLVKLMATGKKCADWTIEFSTESEVVATEEFRTERHDVGHRDLGNGSHEVKFRTFGGSDGLNIALQKDSNFSVDEINVAPCNDNPDFREQSELDLFSQAVETLSKTKIFDILSSSYNVSVAIQP